MRKYTKHGKRDHPLYDIYYAMLRRCHNEKDRNFASYGGRGIHVCEKWQRGYAMFYNDMISSYQPELTLDRIDNSLGYSPQNCRWVSSASQMRNTRRTKLITFNGKTQCIMDWASEMKIHWRTLHWRISTKKWETGKALTTPASKERDVKGRFATVNVMNGSI